MWASWGFLGLIQIISNRYLKQFWKASMVIHRVTGILIWFATFLMCIFVLKKVSWKLAKGLHPLIGLGVFIAVGIISLGGFAARFTMQKTRWNTNRVIWIKTGHRLFSYLLIIAAQAAIVTGGIRFAEQGHPLAKTLCIIHAIAFTGILVLSEIAFRFFQRKEVEYRDP